MIKLILPDDQKFSYKYDKHLSVKEVLNNFCKENGLLSDIYEAYNPKRSKSLDCNKNLFEYNLNSLHLRRIDQNISSNQDSQEKLQSVDSDKLWNEKTIQTYSQNSFYQIKNDNDKKNKKIFKNPFKKKDKKQKLSRSYSENLESPVNNQIMTLSTDKIYQDSLNSDSIKTELKLNTKNGKKKKRLAPQPPIKNVITFSFEDGDSKFKSFDLEIPQPPPPSTEFIGHYNYYPWQSCVECHTGNDSPDEESIYSIIPECLTPFPVSEHRVIEPPKCPSNVSDDETENENYIYSQIQKKTVINNICDNNIETTNIDQLYLHKDNQLSNENNVHELSTSDSPNSNSVRLSILDNNKSSSIRSISSESEKSSISSSSNIVNFLRNSKAQISTSDLSNSLNRINKSTLTNEATQIKSNLKSHQISAFLNTPTIKSIEKENVLHTSKIVSNTPLKEFSENISISDKTFTIPKTSTLTGKEGELYKEKLNLTVDNDLSMYNFVKSSPKPTYKYKFKTSNTKTKVIPNSIKDIDNDSTKTFSIDDSIKLQKQGGSLYFSAMHN